MIAHAYPTITPGSSPVVSWALDGAIRELDDFLGLLPDHLQAQVMRDLLQSYLNQTLPRTPSLSCPN